MHDEKRMAGDYEIIQAIMIGDKEIVIGENQANINGHKYMTAVGEWNDLFEVYNNVLVSDDFPEIVGYFGQRVTERAKKTRDERFRPNLEGIDNTVDVYKRQVRVGCGNFILTDIPFTVDIFMCSISFYN